MFNIHFIDSVDRNKNRDPQDGEVILETAVPYRRMIANDGTLLFDAYGEITIGQFSEGFRSPLFYWSKQRYEAQWRSALIRLIVGSEKTAIFTAVYDPATAKVFTWWPIYREGKTVFIQNQLLFVARIAVPFDIEDMDEFIKPRQTVTEDGKKISEWSVPFADIQEFASTWSK